ISTVVDHLTGTEHVLWLERGSGVGDFDLAVDAKFVEGTGSSAGDIGDVPAIGLAAHRCRLVEDQLDLAGRRCPTPEFHALISDHGTKLMQHAVGNYLEYVSHPNRIDGRCSGAGTFVGRK